jgi:hypothetical protein
MILLRGDDETLRSFLGILSAAYSNLRGWFVFVFIYLDFMGTYHQVSSYNYANRALLWITGNLCYYLNAGLHGNIIAGLYRETDLPQVRLFNGSKPTGCMQPVIQRIFQLFWCPGKTRHLPHPKLPCNP